TRRRCRPCSTRRPFPWRAAQSSSRSASGCSPCSRSRSSSAAPFGADRGWLARAAVPSPAGSNHKLNDARNAGGSEMKVLVCGGGVIGASVALFLARRGAEVEVVERTAVACAASGKAGGFLAHDWCDGTPLEALARRSFDLHASLAEELDGDWGYRRMSSFGGFSGGRAGAGRGLPWLADGVTVAQRLGTADTNAQVHPARFTEALMRAAEAHGARLRIGEVTGLVRDGDGRVRGAL